MSDQNQPDMTTNQQTAIRIREERLKQNITQQAIADHLGIDISSYSRLENGTVEITITRLEAIAEFFKVPMSNFISSSTNVKYMNNGDNYIISDSNVINCSDPELKKTLNEFLAVFNQTLMKCSNIK